MPLSCTDDVASDTWAQLADLQDASRSALVIGGIDTGKTTLVRYLADRWVSQGLRVALISVDPGQPIVGLPGTFSLTFLPEKGETVLPDRIAFVGRTSLSEQHLDLLLGFARLFREAIRLAPDRVLIDTCGLVQGSVGVSLKRQEVDLCAPVEVLALQRGNKLEPILLPFRNRTDIRIRRLTPLPGVKKKTPLQRRRTRRERFASYFAGACLRTLCWRSTPFQDLPVGLGTAVAPDCPGDLSRRLGISLMAAERYGDCAAVFGRGNASREALRRLKEYFAVSAIAYMDCEDLEGRLTALQDPEGWTAGLGILCRMAPEQQEATFWTPLPQGQEIAAVRLGLLALDPSGRELGSRGAPVTYT